MEIGVLLVENDRLQKENMDLKNKLQRYKVYTEEYKKDGEYWKGKYHELLANVMTLAARYT